MAKEALDKVREAEVEASKIVVKASEEARQVRSDAEKKAAKRYDEILAQGEKEATILKQEAQKMGDTLAKPILENGQVHNSRIEEMKEKDLESAVNIIIERIVKADGHR